MIDFMLGILIFAFVILVVICIVNIICIYKENKKIGKMLKEGDRK